MALELTAHAEAAIEGFFRREDALEELAELYTSTLAQLEKRRIKADKPVEFVHNILDVAVQRVVEKLSWALLKTPDATLSSVGVPALLDLCIAGVGKKLLINSAPYKVLEDLMDGQTISNCEKLWTLLESRKEKLTTSDFIPAAGRTTKASLCLLKMCNALLRRLSKTHNSVFCGKILVFLSFTFALSERSAVNLMGKPNVSNVTAFEDQDEFETAEAIDSAAAADALPARELESHEHGADAGPIDYNLYRTFWDLQRYFREHDLAVQSAANWEKFFDEMSVVLAAFEGNAFSSDDLERTRDLLTATASSERDASQDHYFQPKYLTNSRLFRLQLRDPILRESMLTQFLILFHYLAKAKVPADATTPKAKVAEMHARVAKLLEQTPSDSEGFSDLVARVLERERNWTKWKQEKCPPYEKYAAAADSPKKKPQQAAPRLGDAGALSARPAFVKRVRSATDKDTSSLMEQILTESAKPSELLAKIKGSERASEVPLATYMERFTEAWDPENGIEEEYWPDKDTMHCWRTMRTAMKSRVEHLDLAINGAGAIVKGILNLPDAKQPTESPTAAGASAAAGEAEAPESSSAGSDATAAKGEQRDGAKHGEKSEQPPLKRVRTDDNQATNGDKEQHSRA